MDQVVNNLLLPSSYGWCLLLLCKGQGRFLLGDNWASGVRAGESPSLKDEVELEMGYRSSQGCSVQGCQSQPLTDLVLGRMVGLTQAWAESLCPSECRAQCSSARMVLGSCACCGTSPGCWGWLITAGSRRGLCRAKTAFVGRAKQTELKAGWCCAHRSQLANPR